ncbi:nucleoside-triphosphatase [Lederbergia citri]|uniref:AAA family ATPase n=1 Tax=Lederbergia citri TaxID=2833580 RepID=A0A942YF69_9BACI|nr:nucleoside-triphosphatase [Lederbergia citri]MBS4194177.1 AAA family ATPase [Lederbergia citri]
MKFTLLTAEPGTGKTTCIRKIINAIGIENCEGFYTEEVRKDDVRTGFVCVFLTGERTTLADIDSISELRLGRYGIELEDFGRLVIPTIEKALTTKKFLIIDEIGLMQLFSERFKETVNKVLNSDKIIIGTIFFNSHPEVDKLKENPNVHLVSITKENRDTIPYEIADELRKIVK